MSPTHTAGHTIDLLITKSSDGLINSVNVHDPGISDHSCVTFGILDKKPSPIKKTVTYRKLKSVDTVQFQKDISNVKMDIKLCQNVTAACKVFEENMKSAVNTHAPMVTKSFTVRPNTQWYNANIRKAKVVKRRYERAWKKSGQEVHHKRYQEQCKFINFLMKDAKREFVSGKIMESKDDKKKFFSVTKNILNWKSDPVLPSNCPLERLPNDFNHFFIDKIIKIQDTLNLDIHKQAVDTILEEVSNVENINSLSNFRPATEDEIQKIVMSSSNATCSLDSIPTTLLKSCLPELLTPITDIVNLSLAEATVPSHMKKAVVMPLIKKITLDKDNMKNYRPVSNLNFISKIIEKVVAKRLNEHLIENKLTEKMQSAYRQFHSTETAVLRVQNDISKALHNKQMVALVLLDLSAAFDTIDHKLLLSRLEKRFKVTGTVLKWFRSYLTDRSQTVTVTGCDSDEIKLTCGVPQGSVLGPILFTLYTSPVGDIARKHNMGHHFYADDSQLYVSFSPKCDLNDKLNRLEVCISDIKQWMLVNLLKLNDDKTEVILFGSPFFLKIHPSISIQIGKAYIDSHPHVRNLGAIFDSKLSMDKFINFKVSSTNYYLRNIAKIRRILSVQATKSLIHAYVTSRLDYCNSLLIGINKTQMKKLQNIQNTAARLVMGVGRDCDISAILHELHWLPVWKRIIFKVLVHVFNSINGAAPEYFKELMPSYKSTGVHLRGYDALLLETVTTQNKYGDRCFEITGPKLWNCLPLDVRRSNSITCFKKLLKTFLFTLNHDSCLYELCF